jgi:hypothetical protein
MPDSTRTTAPRSAPIKKIDALRGHMKAGEWTAALKLAATFPKLGTEAKAIRQGWEACSRPGFQQQLGKDPAAIIGAGVAALLRRYGAAAPAAGAVAAAQAVPAVQVKGWCRQLRTLRRGLPLLIFQVADDMAAAVRGVKP